MKGTVFTATGRNLLPYVEQCTLELIDLTKHYYEGIRKSALDSLLEIVRTLYSLSDHQEWVAGKTVVGNIDFPASHKPLYCA